MTFEGKKSYRLWFLGETARRRKNNQTVVVEGETGSGKTNTPLSQ